MKIIKTCIITKSSENLNTSMNFEADGEEYKVFLCDDVAEDTTPRKAKEALQERLDAINNLKEQADGLGLKFELPNDMRDTNSPRAFIDIGDGKYECVCGKVCNSKGGLTQHQKKCSKFQDFSQSVDEIEIIRPTAQQVAQITNVKDDIQETKEPNSPVRTYMPSMASQNIKSSVSVSNHGGINTENEIKRLTNTINEQGGEVSEISDGITEIQEVRDAAGGSTVIPKNFSSGSVMVKDSTDRDLQSRFKQTADESMDGYNSSSYSGSNEMTCPICKGSGIARIGNVSCPKCSGSGLILS